MTTLTIRNVKGNLEVSITSDAPPPLRYTLTQPQVEQLKAAMDYVLLHPGKPLTISF